MAEPLLEDGELLGDLIKTTTNVIEPVVENGLKLTNGTNGEVELNGSATENGNSASPVCEIKVSVTIFIDLRDQSERPTLRDLPLDTL